MTNLTSSQLAYILRNQRPDRDGTRHADGARDEWETVRLAIRKALGFRGVSDESDEFDAACMAPTAEER